MSATTHPFGFRIVGPCTNDRRRVDAATAFQAYCGCDVRANVATEGYLSAFQFAGDFAEHLARAGSPAGFAGSTWAPWIWLDVDRDEDAGGIPRALADTKLLVDTLDESFGVPRELLVPFLSGGKGFHLGIPTALWQPPPSMQFHLVARAFAESIATEGKVAIDVGVFDRLRAFRAPNSRHPKTGLHKRHIPPATLDDITVDNLLEIAQQPAPFTPPDVASTESPDFLVNVWSDAERAVIERLKAVQENKEKIADGTRAMSVNRKTRAFLHGDVQVGEREVRLFSAAANLAEIGCPLSAVKALLTEPALDLGLSPKVVARQIECGNAAANPLVKHAVDVLGGTVVAVVDGASARSPA